MCAQICTYACRTNLAPEESCFEDPKFKETTSRAEGASRIHKTDFAYLKKKKNVVVITAIVKILKLCLRCNDYNNYYRSS